jgi:hypothetical protein
MSENNNLGAPFDAHRHARLMEDFGGSTARSYDAKVKGTLRLA